jgi:hypothetical protein
MDGEDQQYSCGEDSVDVSKQNLHHFIHFLRWTRAFARVMSALSLESWAGRSPPFLARAHLRLLISIVWAMDTEFSSQTQEGKKGQTINADNIGS